MRVYTKVVINMESLVVEKEEFYEYSGDVIECKSGGAGGGSPVGTSDFPAYMKTCHGRWLDNSGADTPGKSVTAAMRDAMSGDSPFANARVLNVEEVFLGANIGVTSFHSPFYRLSDFACFDVEQKYSEYFSISDSDINTLVDAEAELLDDEIYSKVLPSFQAAMDDINAVQSSNFVLGEAIIWDGRDKALAKNDAAIRVERLSIKSEIALKRIATYIEWSRLINTLSAELARMYVAARHDVDSLTTELKAKDRLFDLGVFQFGVNVMSSISGSAVSPPDPGSGKSGLGGPLSGAIAGAAAGAFLGGPTGLGLPTGIAVGAALGLAGSL